MKNFGFKNNGSHWSIWWNKNWFKIGKDIEYLDFYILPTIKVSYHEDTFETDEYDFSIDFVWLLWKLCITKYWGKAYERK